MAIDDGNLWVSDVGELKREEVNIVEKGKNYGWNILEGTHCYTPEANCAQTQFEEPEIEYGRETGRCVTGGHVHRGAGSLHGKYIFGDWSTGRIWSYNGEMELLADTDYHIGSIARDEAGDVYAITIEAKVLKVTEMEDLSAETPTHYTMKTSAYPTPFSGGATIEYALESPGRVTFEVYDALGRRIGAVDEGMRQAGIHRIEWRGESVGVYYYRVLSGSESGGGVLIKAR